MRTQAINIWSSPRNISTALMYSFAQRNDMTVVDEPLYAHYLRVSGADHPVKEEIINSQNPFAENVIRDVILNNYATPYVLHKQMTHHLVDLDWRFLLQSQNVIIIRNPREIIASYAKIITNPTIRDVGIKKQMEVYHFLLDNNKLAAVIDTNELLKNPKKILIALCEELDIHFDDEMLSWNAGARKEDGIWAEYWYANVHRSTGFKKYVKKEVYLSEELEELEKECMPFYEQLFDKCVKV
jgi:hypothetical protein